MGQLNSVNLPAGSIPRQTAEEPRRNPMIRNFCIYNREMLFFIHNDRSVPRATVADIRYRQWPDHKGSNGGRVLKIVVLVKNRMIARLRSTPMKRYMTGHYFRATSAFGLREMSAVTFQGVSPLQDTVMCLPWSLSTPSVRLTQICRMFCHCSHLIAH